MKEDQWGRAFVPYQDWNEITEIIIHKIVTAFSDMNIDKLVELLDEDIDYQDLDKWRFLALIKKKFEKFKKQEDTYLLRDFSQCMGCSFGTFGFVFKGNRSKRKWSLVFKVEVGVLIDIYECNMMLGHHVEDNTEPTGDLPF